MSAKPVDDAAHLSLLFDIAAYADLKTCKGCEEMLLKRDLQQCKTLNCMWLRSIAEHFVAAGMCSTDSDDIVTLHLICSHALSQSAVTVGMSGCAATVACDNLPSRELASFGCRTLQVA